MTAKGVVTALNRESVQAIARLVQLIGFPVIATIGTMVYNQADILISNQEKMLAKQEQHSRSLTADSVAITDLIAEDYKLHRYDQLFTIKQDAAKDALQNNSVIGIEFKVDYDEKYRELVGENRFLNP